MNSASSFEGKTDMYRSCSKVGALAFWPGVALFGAVFAVSANAAPFGIGPLTLGVTNKEVSKHLELKNCRDEAGGISCTSEIEVLGELYGTKLIFHKKRLVSVDLRLVGWGSDDPRLPLLHSTLQMAQCPANGLDGKASWFSKEICYKAPDQYRHISWDGGLNRRYGSRAGGITITLMQSRGLYTDFVKRRTESQQALEKRKALEEFAKGR